MKTKNSAASPGGHSQSSPHRDPQTSERLTAYLAEYSALRSEIEWLVRDGTQYQGLAVKLIGVVFGAAAWIIHQVPDLLLPLLLVVPFVFCTLGFLFSRQHEEVYIVARYIKDYIRPRMRDLLRDAEVWGWEEFKASAMKDKELRARIPAAATAKSVHGMRMMIFLFPALISLTIIAVEYAPNVVSMTSSYGRGLVWIFAFTAIMDLVVFVAFILHLFTQTDFAKRTGLHRHPKGSSA